MLQINKTSENGKTVFTLTGRLDTATAPELEHALQSSLDDTSELILDFEKLTYISSAGLRVLLTTQKAMAKRGKLSIAHINETVREIFEITGFSEILTIL